MTSFALPAKASHCRQQAQQCPTARSNHAGQGRQCQPVPGSALPWTHPPNAGSARLRTASASACGRCSTSPVPSKTSQGASLPVEHPQPPARVQAQQQTYVCCRQTRNPTHRGDRLDELLSQLDLAASECQHSCIVAAPVEPWICVSAMCMSVAIGQLAIGFELCLMQLYGSQEGLRSSCSKMLSFTTVLLESGLIF